MTYKPPPPNQALAEMMYRDAEERPLGYAGEFLGRVQSSETPPDETPATDEPGDPTAVDNEPTTVAAGSEHCSVNEPDDDEPSATPNLDRVLADRAERAENGW